MAVTWEPGVTKHAILAFQTDVQLRQATNESNRVFLYCAFLDFRYCLRGPEGWGSPPVCQGAGPTVRKQTYPLPGDKLSAHGLGFRSRRACLAFRASDTTICCVLPPTPSVPIWSPVFPTFHVAIPQGGPWVTLSLGIPITQ